MTALASERDRLVSGFGEISDALAEDGPPWLAPLRAAAILQFAELGFPTRKREDWKYTNPAPIARALADAPSDAGADDGEQATAAAVLAGLASALVFVNGRLAPKLSAPPALPQGAVVDGLARVLVERPELVAPHWRREDPAAGRALVALNTAFQRDGAFVSLPPNTRIGEPIELVFVTTDGAAGRACHPRNLVVLGDSSEAVVVERHLSLGDSAGLTNAVSELVLAPNARLDHVVLGFSGDRATHLESCVARLEANARLRSHAISLGAALARNELEVELAGPGAECDLYGLYIATGDRHVDNQTVIDHVVPHCTSRELYKGILDGRGRGVFNGKVIVRPDAQKTNAVQSNQNLLLSEGAEIDTRPNLEIHADDVKCAHGSTVGRLDDDALFFLRARGIGERKARQMLCRAFAAEVIDAIPSTALREEIQRHVAAALSDGAAPA